MKERTGRMALKTNNKREKKQILKEKSDCLRFSNPKNREPSVSWLTSATAETGSKVRHENL